MLGRDVRHSSVFYYGGKTKKTSSKKKYVDRGESRREEHFGRERSRRDCGTAEREREREREGERERERGERKKRTHLWLVFERDDEKQENFQNKKL